ncbi:MAG: prolipoprotein diacylglyceryl transferase [Candidatus Omnitrophota bacterium]
MHPVLLTLGAFSIYSYGTMLAIGFAVSLFLIRRNSSGFGLDSNRMTDTAVIVLIAGISGARLLYVAMNSPYYLRHPLDVLKLPEGGLVWYGGFFFGLAAMWFYLRWQKLSFWNTADLFAPYVALAQSFGRIGCFLNGCCFGKEAQPGSLLGVIFPGSSELRLPAQVYSALALLAIFVILRIWQGRRKFYGEIFLGYCVLYSSKRFLAEFLRGDNAPVAYGLTFSQVVSAALFLCAVSVLIYRIMLWKRRP